MATERLSLRIDADIKKRLEREAKREACSTFRLAVRALEAMLWMRTCYIVIRDNPLVGRPGEEMEGV